MKLSFIIHTKLRIPNLLANSFGEFFENVSSYLSERFNVNEFVAEWSS
jgi:hypothetical protein